MPLTDIACKKATCPDTKARERYTDSGGLYLEVLPSGSKYWRWKYYFAGKEKRLALGTYPDVSLVQARLDRDKARGALKEGDDPVQLRKDAKAARRVAIGTSFEVVAMSWWEQWRGTRSPRHADYVLRRLQLDVFPELGRKPVADILAPHILAMAKKIEARGALDIAKRCYQTCGQVFRYAIAHGLAVRNPCADVKPSDALKPRQVENFARLHLRDVPELLLKIDAYQGSAYTRLAMKLMTLTFVRTTELVEVTWDEIDLERAEWRIPAERMKMRFPHIVPLSRQAIEVIRTLEQLRNRSRYVFPGERDHEKPMSNNTILTALKRMGYAGRMTGHGFRSIASTALSEWKFPEKIVEPQLAHMKRNQVAAIYNTAEYLTERAEMMQWYADYIDSIRQGGPVLPVKKAA
jgi:integrase